MVRSIIITATVATVVSALSPTSPVRFFPFFVNTIKLVRTGDFDEIIAQTAHKFGPVSRLRCRSHDLWFISSPALVREVCSLKGSLFADREYRDARVDVGCPGIVASRSADHSKFRNALNPTYFSTSAVAMQLERTEEECSIMLAEEDADSLAKFLLPSGGSILVNFCARLALRVQYRTIFNQTLPRRELANHRHSRSPLSPSVRSLNSLAAHALIGWRQFKACISARKTSESTRPSFMTFVRLFTNRRKHHLQLTASLCRDFGPRKRDFARGLAKRLANLLMLGKSSSSAGSVDRLGFEDVELMCRARIQQTGASSINSDQGGTADDVLQALIQQSKKLGLEDSVVEALAKDLVAAGSDTTAAAITMTLSELIQDAERGGAALKIVRSEAALVGHGQQLEFTRACVKESLRLHPPAPLFFRVASEETTLGDNYTIPKGSAVIMSASWLGKDPDYWGSDSHIFKPERFIKNPERIDKDGVIKDCDEVFDEKRGKVSLERHSFSYAPFGAGPRACLGARVVMEGVPNVVAAIVAAASPSEATEVQEDSPP